MTESYDPSEMTEEEADEVADEVERQRKREESKYGHLLNDD
jgi:hypothetical protein